MVEGGGITKMDEIGERPSYKLSRNFVINGGQRGWRKYQNSAGDIA